MARTGGAINEIIHTALRYRLDVTGMWYLDLKAVSEELARRVVGEMWRGISRHSLIDIIQGKVRGLELVAAQPTQRLLPSPTP